MQAGSLRVAGGVLIILLAVFLIYILANRPAAAWLISVAAMAQITAAAWLLSGRWSSRCRAAILVVMLALAGAVAIFSEMPARAIGFAVTGGCHAIAYSTLLGWFGASLQLGHEPVVTGIARRIRRTTPDKVLHYTRQVTAAWCVFFAAQLALSATLLLVAPVLVWSTFVTLLNLPLIIAMGLAEFGYRMILFRHEGHTSLIDTLSALRRARFMPAGRP